MNETTILDEVYAARRSLFEEAGGSLDGLFKFLREHPIPGVRYADLPIAKPRRLCLRPLSAPHRDKSVAHP